MNPFLKNHDPIRTQNILASSACISRTHIPLKLFSNRQISYYKVLREELGDKFLWEVALRKGVKNGDSGSSRGRYTINQVTVVNEWASVLVGTFFATYQEECQHYYVQS